MKKLIRFLNNDSGATAIEYGLIASLISVAIIGATRSLGTKISSNFAKIAGNMP